MLHHSEYRLYWALWAIVPVMLATTMLTMPALQKAPEIQILVSDSVPDHLYHVGEAITFSFRADALRRDSLQATWTFGDSVDAWQLMPADSSETILSPRLAWEGGATIKSGLHLQVQYDTLKPEFRPGWIGKITLRDTTVHVKFREPGQYRLKLDLQDRLTGYPYLQEMIVQIVKAKPQYLQDTSVRIIGPKVGLAGEELVFSATGSKVKFWSWRFGDEKGMNMHQPQVVYAYSTKGKYVIELQTDNPDRVTRHEIEILPTWNADSAEVVEPDTIDVIGRYQIDLRQRLQAIADATTAESAKFYDLKKRIWRDYLRKNGNVDVWVNEDVNPVDFDSYCQRIHFLAGELLIEKVAFNWDNSLDSTGRRIRELFVTQRNRTNEK
jgi:hypothetical protein